MVHLNFNPFPILSTERLVLRRVTEADVQEMFVLRSDTEIMKYIPRPLATNFEEAIEHIKSIDEKIESSEGINWGITLKGNDTLIGVAGFYRISPENHRAEIGYILHPSQSGKGIISEVVKHLIEFGFTTMNLHSIEAVIAPENKASSKVLEKNGFVQEGLFKENQYFEGRFLDAAVYGLLNKRH
ncbi:GNAT family N-acetyltransferase [Flavobacterium sp.]|uniref:GNAT family N-acetyltransferase n=1 Tax=Flavobacterium sp. TaxID=239 RepID=UPI0026124507|nr:GNAT family N-acetyltransferase [Flavobacterium sp.]MDG2432821.1 GNAT family N-acetyltransferase [Flavobacterium sp.]